MIKQKWKDSPIYNKYIKKNQHRYTEMEIDDMVELNVGQLEYFYLHNKDLAKFKIELNDYIGAICRSKYQGFQQRTDMYKDLRERVAVFVLGCLEGKIVKKGKTYEYREEVINKLGDTVKTKFPSWVQHLILWDLLNFFNKWNIERITEVDFDLCNEHKIDDAEISVDFLIKKYIIDFKLNLDIEDVYDYLSFGDYNPNKIEELKLICWLLRKSY
jgi:hypothetical protein